jgi:hypothetical protein
MMETRNEETWLSSDVYGARRLVEKVLMYKAQGGRDDSGLCCCISCDGMCMFCPGRRTESEWTARSRRTILNEARKTPTIGQEDVQG